MKRLLLLILLSCLSWASFAQVDSILLKQARLLKNEHLLQHGLDSLQVLLKVIRNQYSQSNSDSVASEIIRLENQIYDIRSMLSKVGVQLAQYEAQLSKADPGAVTEQILDAESADLLQNAFFKRNISSKELSIILQNKDKDISKLLVHLDQLYKQVLDLKVLFNMAQTQDEVNVMMNQALKLKAEISKLDSGIASFWSNLYNHKIDNYIVLLDKLGSVGRDNLEMIDQLGREVVQNELILSTSMAPNTSLLPYQRSLVLGYEMALAQELKLVKAFDSLSKVNAQKKVYGRYDDIVFPYRSVVLYSNITIDNEYEYSSLNDIPMLKLPSKGLYYSVQVAYVTGQVSSLSIFKGGQPLQQEVVGSKTRYLLGGFRTYSDVSTAVKECYKFGYKSPLAVAWLDGKSITLQAAQSYQKSHPVADIASGYKVEIITDNTEFSSRLKVIVDIHANGKSISRLNSSSSYVYTVSTFGSIEEAHVFSEIIKTEFGNLKTSVISIDDNKE